MSKKLSGYKIGFGKPPKSTQFKKGQTGNPKGRPKGARGLKTDLFEELSAKVSVIENGKTQKITKQRVVIKRLVEKAAKGDMRAVTKLIDLNIAMFGLEGEIAKSKTALSQGDQAIIDLALERMQAEQVAKEPDDDDEPS